MQKTKIILFLLLISFSSLSFAGWVNNAKKAIEDDQYDLCIDTAKPHKKDEMGLMLLAFCHLQNYTFNHTKADKQYFKSYMDLLEDKVSAKSLDNIFYFVQLSDKPTVVKEARKLVKRAFKNIHNIEDVPKLIKFMDSDDKKTQKMAFNSAYRIIKPKRKYVQKGGTLREKDIHIMSNEKLIRTLLKHAKNSKASKTLVMIEKPVLKYISDYDGKSISKLEVKINKAIAKREKKYPKSNWYSATGKKRS